MAVSMYDIAIPTFQKQLSALDAILDKAEAYATAKKIDIAVLLAARLYPDMFNLTRQVQLATDFAKAAPARLAGLEVPSLPDTETTLPELKARIAKVQALLAGYKPEQLDGSDTRQLTLKLGGTGRDVERARISAARRIAELLFPLRDRLQHPATQRPRNRQAGFSRPA